MTLNCLSRLQDLNLRPAHYKYAALPSELRRHEQAHPVLPRDRGVQSAVCCCYTMSQRIPPGRLPPDLHTAPTKAGMADDVLSRPRFCTGMAGLEPTADRLTAGRSCQLSYMPNTDPRGYDPRFAVLETAVFSVYTKDP